MTLLAYTSTYARDEGLGRPFVEGLTRNGLLFAFATALAVSVFVWRRRRRYRARGGVYHVPFMVKVV